MKSVIQRVKDAAVSVDGKIIGKIGCGLLVFVGVGAGDTETDMEFTAQKLVNMRIFSDSGGKMNLSVGDAGGEILLISQFTLFGDCSRGRRPYFGGAMEPTAAKAMYEKLANRLCELGIHTETGIFGADMQVSLTNDGPVTIILDSEK